MESHLTSPTSEGEPEGLLLNILQQSTPACLVWVDAQGHPRFATAACQTLFGDQSLEEALARGCQAEGASPCLLHHPDRFTQREEHNTVFSYQSPSGETRWLAHSCRAHYTPQGEFLGRIGIFIDLTAQHESEEHSRRVSQQFQQLYQMLEALNRAETPPEVYEIAVQGILTLLQADGAAVLLSGKRDRLQLVASQGLSPTCQHMLEEHSPWPLPKGPIQPLWHENIAQSDTIPPPWRAAFQNEGIGALAFIPLHGNTQDLLGTLMVYYRAPHAFSASERQLARILGNDLTAAILRVQAHEALKESEARFRALAESTPAAIYLIENNRFIYTNPAFHKLTGYSLEELQRLRYWEILEEDSRPTAIERARRRMQGHPVSEYVELQIVRKDGQRRWALAGDRVVDLGGRIVAIGSAIDITPLKQTEIALRESEARYRDLIENLRDGIGLHSLDGKVLTSNPTVPRLLGQEDLPEGPIYIQDLLAPEVRHEFANYIQRLQQNGVAEGLMLVQLPPDGRKRLWEYHSTLRAVEGSQPVVRFYVRDVTERERATRALRESEARFRALAESTVAGIYVLVDERFVYTNPALSALTGYSEEELQKISPWDLVHPDFQETVRARTLARLRGEPAPSPYELQIVTKSGEIRWLLLGAERITWQERQALMGSVVDITAHKRYESALEAEIHIAQAFGKTAEEGLQALATRIVEAAHDLIPAAERVVLMLSDEENHLCIEAERGQPPSPNNQCFPCQDAVEAMQHHQQPFRLHEAPSGFNETCMAHFTLSPHAAVVPFVVGEEVIGALLLDSSTSHPSFSPEDMRLLEHFATTATLLLQDARLVTHLKRRLQEMEAVHHITIALRNTADLKDTLQVLLDETLKIVDSEVGAILIYDPVEDLLQPIVARGWMKRFHTPLRPGQGVGGTVFLRNEAYFSPDFSRDPITDAEGKDQIPPGWGGTCLPLHVGDNVLGVMFILRPPNQYWTDAQRYLLQTLAEIGGITLHRIGLLSETRRRLQQLQSLQVVAQAITGSLDLQLTLNILIEQVQAQFQTDAVDVLLIDAGLFSLSVVASAGFHSPQATHRRMSMNASLPGMVALQGAPTVLNNLTETPPPYENCRIFLQRERIRTYIGIPLVAKGQTKGVLELFYRRQATFSPEQIDFLTHLARYAAIALDNAQMVESLQRSANELRAAYEATIEGWARALELRDKETEGHAQRVATLTVTLARRLGVPEERLPHIRRGALLHDIGKMGVPDHILHKPGPLDDEEWEIMRRHPLWAYEMLKEIPYLQPALAIPLFHHERWDGSGYPAGLAGEAIPLAARIFAVVDVYDALTSDRPYRPAWSKDKALAYLEEQKGKLFDPQVVEAFLEIMRAGQPTSLTDAPSS